MSDLDRRHVVDATTYFDSWLAFQRDHQRVPGVQFAVLHGDDLIASAAHGVASEETGEALTPGHLFRIASHSKTFTATAVLQLVERGSVRLDDPVGDHVDGLAGSDVAAVTVRELLTHGGGVIRDGHDGDFWQLERPFPGREELLAMARDGRILPRNARFKYSNVGYSLLGLVIEAASGQRYADYVDEQILRPLGLADTAAEYDAGRADDYATGHTALGYAADRLPIDHVDTAAMASATGFSSTAADVVRYAAAHFDGVTELVGDDARRQLQKVEWAIDGTPQSYGLGFEVSTIGERRVLGHGGGYPGHITRTYFDPVDRLAVSVLTNAIDGPALGWAQTFIRLVDLAADAGPDSDAGSTRPLDHFTGRFATLWGVFDIVDLGGRLVYLSPALADPTVSPTVLEVVDDSTARIVRTAGYGSFGELITYQRAADGTIESIRAAASTAYPIDRFRNELLARERITVDRVRPRQDSNLRATD